MIIRSELNMFHNIKFPYVKSNFNCSVHNNILLTPNLDNTFDTSEYYSSVKEVNCNETPLQRRLKGVRRKDAEAPLDRAVH